MRNVRADVTLYTKVSADDPHSCIVCLCAPWTCTFITFISFADARGHAKIAKCSITKRRSKIICQATNIVYAPFILSNC